MTPMSLASMAATTRRTTSMRAVARWRTRPFAAMSSSSTSSSGPGKEKPSPPSANNNQTPFEIEEMKKLAERTLGEQKALVSQKWEEIKTSWAENKSADDASKAKAQVDTSEWSVQSLFWVF